MLKAIVMVLESTSHQQISNILSANSITTGIVSFAEVEHRTDKHVQVNEALNNACLLVTDVKDVAQGLAWLNKQDKVDKIVVSGSPELALAKHLLLSANKVTPPESVLAHWQTQADDIIEYTEQYSEVLICDNSDIYQHQTDFIASTFDLEPQQINTVLLSPLENLATLWAKSVLMEDDSYFASYDEVLGIIHLFGEFHAHLGVESEEIQQQSLQLVSSFIELEKAQADSLTVLKGELKAEQAKHEQQLAEANNKFKQLEQQLTQTTEALEQERQLHESAKRQQQQSASELSTALQELVLVQDKLSDALQQVTAKNDELELTRLQVAQLQEELESTVNKLTNSNQEIEQQKNIAEQAQSELQQQKVANETQQSSIDELQAELELATLQIAQLQEELESTFGELSTAKQKQAALVNDKEAAETAHNNKQLELTQQKQAMENQATELELASLQIAQLQEELEYYYLEYQAAKENSMQITTSQVSIKAFDKAHADAMTVSGEYQTDGYSDIHLLLTNVHLVDGRQFNELPVKLVNAGGQIGIEFRDNENLNHFRTFADCTDDYGPYLNYFADPQGEVKEKQVTIVNRMNASERLLVMSVINIINEQLHLPLAHSNIVIDNPTLLQWRLAANKLANNVAQLPQWLSFDNVKLRESFSTDGYEHLWLTFDKTLVNDIWRDNLEFKIAASQIVNDENDSDEQGFAKKLILEFRENEQGQPPLFTWPPEVTDDFGPKFIITLNDKEALAGLTTSDAALINLLTNNLEGIVNKLDADVSIEARSKEEWITCISARKAEQREQPEQREQRTDKAEELEADTPAEIKLLAPHDIISMGSYQHIVFVEQNTGIKVKLRAQNINPETFDAETFLELRHDNNVLPYTDNEFFAEDEYGPRVLVPVEWILNEAKESNADEFNWLLSVYQALNTMLNDSDSMDSVTRKMWLRILQQKLDA